MDRVIGIDVSKLRLDVYRLADGRRLAVGNDAGGIAALADQLGLGPPAVTSDRPLSARQEVSDENGRRGQPFSHRPTFPGSVNHAFCSRSSSSTKRQSVPPAMVSLAIASSSPNSCSQR